MKEFLFNTRIGVGFTILVISMTTILISITTSLILYGGGIMIFNDLLLRDLITLNVFSTCTTIWTLMNIVILILLALWMWIQLMIRVNNKYNKDEE